MNSKEQLSEIEKGCGKRRSNGYPTTSSKARTMMCGEIFTYTNVCKGKKVVALCRACKSKKEGFLMGMISQLKEEKDFILTGIHLSNNRLLVRLDQITSDLKFYEDKLQEMKYLQLKTHLIPKEINRGKV